MERPPAGRYGHDLASYLVEPLRNGPSHVSEPFDRNRGLPEVEPSSDRGRPGGCDHGQARIPPGFPAPQGPPGNPDPQIAQKAFNILKGLDENKLVLQSGIYKKL